MKSSFKSRAIDVLAGFAAYVTARAIWHSNSGVFKNLIPELLTFAVVYLLLQALIRGRRLAAKGK